MEVSNRQMEINALELRGEVTFGSQQRFIVSCVPSIVLGSADTVICDTVFGLKRLIVWCSIQYKNRLLENKVELL